MTRAIRVLSLTLTAAFVTTALVPQSSAQTAPLPLGQVTVTFQMNSCPGSFYQGNGTTNPAVCYGANVSCPSANPIGLTFSYINGNAPNAAKGTIVLFNGSAAR